MSITVDTIDELLEAFAGFGKEEVRKNEGVLPENLASDFFIQRRENIHQLKASSLLSMPKKPKEQLFDGVQDAVKITLEASYDFFIRYIQEEKANNTRSKRKKKKTLTINSIFSNLEYIGMHDTRPRKFPSAVSMASFEFSTSGE